MDHFGPVNPLGRLEVTARTIQAICRFRTLSSGDGTLVFVGIL